MPLVNLRTDLKSLTYGKDRPGGESSGQPFITTNINTGQQSVALLDRVTNISGFSTISAVSLNSIFLEPSRTSLSTSALNESLFTDNFIRGGASGARKASSTDLLRIGSFMVSAPKGFLFIQKQKDLQFSNPKLELAGTGLGTIDITNIGAGTYQSTRGAIGPTRIYSSLNTLKQVNENAFGVHYDRHGLSSSTDRYEYLKVISENSGLSSGTNVVRNNRLINLKNQFSLGKVVTKIAQVNQQQAEQKEKSKASEQLLTARTTAASRLRNLQNNLLGAGKPLGQIAGTLNLNVSQFVSGILGGNRGRTSTILGNSRFPSPTTPPTQENKIDLYDGGPNSVYGQGQTFIQRYSYTAVEDKYQKAMELSNQKAGKGSLGDQLVELNSPNASGSIIANALGTTPLGTSYVPISTYPGIDSDIPSIAKAIGQSPLGVVKDYAVIAEAIKLTSAIVTGSAPDSIYGIFNSQINKETSVNNGAYSTVNLGKIEYRNSYGDVITIKQKSWAAASRERRVGSGKQDSINLTPLFTSKIGQNLAKVTIDGGDYNINDLCKFKIEAIDGSDPSKSVYMVFRAYLNDLSDDVSADWSDIKYVGRGDRFYIYNGFNRTINVSFKVAALSAEEMQPMYQKLNYLMGNMMPDYTDSNLMRGPLSRLTVGNWVDSQPGIIKSLSYKIPQDSPWEIALNEPTAGGSREMILPHIVEVNLTFVPIGSQTQKENKIPRKDNNSLSTSHIAQNYNGASKGEPNYIEGAILSGAPGKPDEDQAAQNTANADNKPENTSTSGANTTATNNANRNAPVANSNPTPEQAAGLRRLIREGGAFGG